MVKSRGGDAEGPLQTAFRKVKYLASDPQGVVRLTDVKTEGLESGQVKFGSDFEITGTNVTVLTDDKVILLCNGKKVEVLSGDIVSSNTSILIEAPMWSAWTESEIVGKTMLFEVVSRGGDESAKSETHVITGTILAKD